MKTPVTPGRPSYHTLGLRGGAISGGHSPDSDIITVVEAGPEPPARSSTLPPPLVESLPLPPTVPLPPSPESSPEEPPRGRDIHGFRHRPITFPPLVIPDSSPDYDPGNFSDMSGHRPSHLDPLSRFDPLSHLDPVPDFTSNPQLPASTMRGAILNEAEFTKRSVGVPASGRVHRPVGVPAPGMVHHPPLEIPVGSSEPSSPDQARGANVSNVIPVQPPYLPDPRRYPEPYPPPEKFSGEEDEDVEVFLDALELMFTGREDLIGDQTKRERAKIAALYRHLEGQARDCWKSLGPANKTTYDLAAAALRRRFPRPDEEVEYWSARTKATVEMNSLSQGGKTTEEYIRKAVSLYGILGDENALTLATKFVDGIDNPTVQLLVDTQMRGVYTSFLEVINAFKICTTTIRRQELTKNRLGRESKGVENSKEGKKSLAGSQKEEKSQSPDLQLIARQVGELGELFKGLLQERGLQDRSSYRPIVGVVDRPQSQTYRAPVTNPPSYPVTNPQSYPATNPQSYIPQMQGGSYGYRPPREMVCFRCGIVGHRANMCSNNPLPREEQDRLRNASFPQNRVSRMNNDTNRQPTSQGPTQAVTCVNIVSTEEIEETDPEGTMMMATNLVDLVLREQREEVIKRLKMGTCTPEDVAYLEAAVAEKRSRPANERTGGPPTRRARIEEYDPVLDQTSQSQTQRHQPDSPTMGHSITVNPQGATMSHPSTGNSQGATISQQVPVPPAARGSSSPVSSPPVQVSQIPPLASAHEGRPFIADPFFEDPANHSQFVPSANIPKPRRIRGEPKPKRHIKMMQGRDVWDPVEALRDLPVTGLDYGSLFDMSPLIRVAISKSLQLQSDKQRPKVRAKGPSGRVVGMIEGSPIENHEVYSVTGFRQKVQGVIDGILPEPNIRFFNFHTTGDVVAGGKRYGVKKILIDGGAVVNLMPEKVARRLDLHLVKNNDILIRTATNEIRNVQFCTQLNIDIAGVVASVTVHVLDIPQSYSLLLGRRWLYQVRAVGDYATHSYVIYDAEGNPHPVPPADGNMNADTPQQCPEILVNPSGDPPVELTDQEREEIMVGQNRMQEIIAKVVADARDQAKEQASDWDQESEPESLDFSATKDDEEEIADNDSIYEYPGCGEDLSPKGRRQ